MDLALVTIIVPLFLTTACVATVWAALRYCPRRARTLPLACVVFGLLVVAQAGVVIGFDYVPPLLAELGDHKGVNPSAKLPAPAIGAGFCIALPFAVIGTSVFAYLHDRHRRETFRQELRCFVCHYDLRGSESGRCPECGTEMASWIRPEA